MKNHSDSGSDNSLKAVKQLYLQMTLAFSIVMVALLIVILLVGVGYYRRIMVSNNNELEKIITETLADSINRVSFSGKYHAQLLIDQMIKRQPRIVYITLTDSDGRVTGSSDRRLLNTIIAENKRKIAASVISSNDNITNNLTYEGLHIREIAMPFRSGYRNEVTGAIFVGISTQKMTQAIRASNLQILSLLGILTLVSLCSTYLLCRHFIAPVRAMAMHMKGIFDYAPLLIRISDSKGKTLHWSQRCAQTMAQTETDFLARELSLVFERNEVIRSEVSAWVGWQQEHFLTTSFPLDHGNDHRATQACAIALDITELKKTVEALKESEARYRDLFDKSGDAMLLCDGDKIIACNDSMVRMLRIPSDNDLSGKSIYEFCMPGEDGNLVASRAFDEAVARNHCRVECSFRRNDNLILPVEISITVIPLGNKKIFHAICRDITERRKAEIELRQQEENLRITLNSIGDAVIATDRSGNIVRMNPLAEKLTGWSASEAEGRTFHDIFHPVDIDSHRTLPSPIETVLKTGQPTAQSHTCILIPRNGPSLIIADNGAPIRNECQEIVGVVMVFRDVTEQKQVEEQLYHSQKMDSIGQLAGGIAHDFNNMLAGIMGAANLLARRLEDKPVLKASADLIIEATNRAAELTKQLLVFARKEKPATAPVGIHRIIAETLQLLKRSIDKNIQIKLTLEAQNDVVVGNAAQLQNVFLNLGLNARDAMPKGGTLSFFTESVYLDAEFCSRYSCTIAPGPYIKIQVVDNGCGMTREVQSHLFEPFFTTKANNQGSGLGLCSVYGTIKSHRGMIRCYSEVDRGTEFKVFLPLEANTPALEPMPDTPTISGHGRILVIDDEDLVRQMACDILEELGYQPIPACDGEEAISIMSRDKESIDLVLLDMVMPKLSGRLTYEGLKKINPEIKVIFSSGFTREYNFGDLLKEKNAKGFLQKPYLIVEMSQAVAAALNSSELTVPPMEV